MIEKAIEVKMAQDVDARPIAMLVQVASRHESNIYIISGDKKVNAKSIMGMMTLGLSAGEEVEIIVEGADETSAMEQIEKYLCGA